MASPSQHATVIRRLLAWFRGEPADSDADDESDDPTAFSLLDASVNYSHGQSDGKAVRELQRSSEHAGELQDAQDRDR